MEITKRILIFHPYLTPYRMDTYNALAKTFDVNVLLTGGEKELATLAFDLEVINRQAVFSYFYYSKGFWIGRHLVSPIYYRAIKRSKPDVVLAHELGINTFVAIILKPIYKYKLCVTIDDSPKIVRTYGTLRKLMRRFVIRRSDGFIVVNPEVKDFLAQKFGDDPHRHHYLPIVQNEVVLKERFHDALSLSKQIFENYVFYGKKVIIFVGRLVQVKAPEVLLEVFAKLYGENCDLRLVFIGGGELEGELKEYVASHNLEEVVYFAGRLSGKNLYAWYNIGQILVLPSRYEPFGAVVNEALVAGCKAVVSDSVGSACLVNENNGFVFGTDDHDSLKNALFQSIEKTPPLNEICVRNSNMNESFSAYINKFINFIDS